MYFSVMLLIFLYQYESWYNKLRDCWIRYIMIIIIERAKYDGSCPISMRWVKTPKIVMILTETICSSPNGCSTHSVQIKRNSQWIGFRVWSIVAICGGSFFVKIWFASEIDAALIDWRHHNVLVSKDFVFVFVWCFCK